MRQREANTQEVEDIRCKLNRLRIITSNLEHILENVEAEAEPQGQEAEARRPSQYVHQHPVVRDIDGVEILIGDTVHFVSRGLYNTTSGIMYKFSASRNRVASKDSRGMPISRAPQNLRVVLN